MITTAQHSITTTAVKIADPAGAHITAHVHVVGNADLYLGGASVTTATGLLIDKEHGVATFQLGPNDALYAIGGAVAETITVLIQR